MRHGAGIDPPNRYQRVLTEPDLEQVAWDTAYLDSLAQRPIEYLDDTSQSLVTTNDSPDVGFCYSANPYRGCAHGCAYCYARNSHEYLGLSAGLDFETKIFVKHRAAELFRAFLRRPTWQPEPIAFSGVTDCYQPAERQFRLTRGCLEVAWEFRQPIGITTKNALVVRDLDLLRPMAELNLVHVNVSLTTLQPELARDLEPRTSTPVARLRAIRELSAAGVPVRVLAAPIIPGLNDSEIPAVLQAAAEAGAQDAAWELLRLPLAVESVFREWLKRTQPLKAARIEGLIRSTRGGKMNDSAWHRRMRGTGPIAQQIGRVFRVFAQKYKLRRGLPEQSCQHFRRPAEPDGQLRLF